MAGSDGWWAPLEYTSYGGNDHTGGRRLALDRLQGNISVVQQPDIVFFAADMLPRTEHEGKYIAAYSEGPSKTFEDAYNNSGAGTRSIFDFYRHNGRINVVFLDGHAGTFSMPGELSQVGINKGVKDD